MEDVIAREVIHGENPDGSQVEIIVEIGVPHPYKDSENEWVCASQVHGLSWQKHRIHGGSALQALCLSLQSVRWALNAFREDGGKLGYEIGQNDFDLDVVFGTGNLPKRS